MSHSLEFLKKIIVPQLHFEGVRQDEKFVKLFAGLYHIELLKDGLDLILTKLKQKQLHFDIQIIKGWDTNVGCFLTNKIILRELSHNILAHEMAHALTSVSGINLGEEFLQCVGYDMKGREPEIITLRAEVKRLMVDALSSYPPQQFLDEIFARYFELLSISRNVISNGDFTTTDVMGFFINITNFIKKIFNPQIRKKIDPQIAQLTNKIELPSPRQSFRDKISAQKQSSWGNRAGSNGMWSNSWRKNIK
ncbi:MAG: hypothetical protein FJX34_03415 [Alphaproteobacteria bacterium]|nr:hypothetical protein [Alphaproteobacteria bacterium]